MPQDQKQIQQGINAASNGDTVIVAAGLYAGPIDFKGKAITVQGETAGVIIQGGFPGPVVSFVSGEGRDSILENVTIQGGTPVRNPDAGGIFINHSSPTIRNSIIQNNQGCGLGVFNGGPLIERNTIQSNTAVIYLTFCSFPDTEDFFGGGVVVQGISPTGLDTEIRGNLIRLNRTPFGGGGISSLNAGRVLIQDNTVTQNLTNEFGGGIAVTGVSAPIIVQNLIYDNTVNPTLISPAYFDTGGGLFVGLGSFAHPTSTEVPMIVNNTIVANHVLSVAGARQAGSQVTYQNMFDNVTFSNNLIIGSDRIAVIDCSDTESEPFHPPLFDHNDVYSFASGGTLYGSPCVNRIGQYGNISVDPNFATDADSDAPYQLRLPSEAIDSGNTAIATKLVQLDLLGRSRLQDAKGLPEAIVDMGVYEAPGVPVVVQPPQPTQNFHVSVDPVSLSVQTGEKGSAVVTVTALNGASERIRLACNSLPAHAFCNFSQQALDVSGDLSKATTLTIATSAPPVFVAERGIRPFGVALTYAAVLLFPIGLVYCQRPQRESRTKAQLFGLYCLFAIGTLPMASCGYFPISTPPGTYTINITGTNQATGVVEQAALTLVVSR